MLNDIYFITGNKDKFAEVQAILPQVKQLNLDLPEIQEIDPQLIIEEKLKNASQHHSGTFIVEDTSLYLDCLNGLPGPLIKWFLKTIGNEGLVRITKSLGNNKAQAKTVIGYMDENREVKFFEGTIKGEIVDLRGTAGFGWDPIFKPLQSKHTFAEMSQEEKNSLSMRRLALNKLQEYLNKSS